MTKKSKIWNDSMSVTSLNAIQSVFARESCMPRCQLSPLEEVRLKLARAYMKLRSWRLVGEEFGVSYGMAWRVTINGYDPKRFDIRQKLGLPTYALVKVCKKCGKAHPTRYCTQSWKDRHYNDLWSMPTLYLLILLRNRETL